MFLINDIFLFKRLKKNLSMERKIRRFKRLHKKEEYVGEIFKKQMEIDNFKYKQYNILEYELRTEISKRSKLRRKIIQLPEEVQRKIYRQALNMYWKEDLLNRNLRPMWCDYKKYIDNEYRKCIIQNIHFLHLDFNTLPENKKWIPGCQCNFCIQYHNNEEKLEEYAMIVEEPDYFYEIINCNVSSLNFWNLYLLDLPVSLRIFDPLCGYIKDVNYRIKESPHINPIDFTNEIKELYN
mgnify:FL=1|tara:strand:+ start:2207 stop:2920 length:714 start_codon:yes stop_codon:yes gene_type:complete